MGDEVLDHPTISQLLFWPRAIFPSSPFQVGCDDAVLVCSYTARDKDAPTIVFIHGNGETVADYSWQLPTIFSIIGCNTFLVEYRGYGGSSGDPSLRRLAADTATAIRAIPAALESIILYGRSLGCLPAACAAAQFPNMRGLILESPIDDVYDYVIKCHELRYSADALFGASHPSFTVEELRSLKTACDKNFNFRSLLASFRGRSMVTYAQADFHIPFDSIQRIFGWLPEPKRLKVFTKGDHNTIFFANTQEYCQEIYDHFGLNEA